MERHALYAAAFHEIRKFFSSLERVHAMKFQSIMCPNGIIAQVKGPYFGSQQDSGTFFQADCKHAFRIVKTEWSLENTCITSLS